MIHSLPVVIHPIVDALQHLVHTVHAVVAFGWWSEPFGTDLHRTAFWIFSEPLGTDLHHLV